jgi:CRISP-associated protein Cas1
MAWKGVHISRPARLSLKDGQIVVAQDDGEAVLPLEDIAWIVLDGAHATLTTTLISACMDCGIALIFTDVRHTPSGLCLPFHQHHRQAAVAGVQLGISQPLKKRLWQAFVMAKISNQAANLNLCVRPGGGTLEAMAKLTGSGDPQNIEARAAREYWKNLFDDFIRDDASDLRNKMLNYGYSIARSAVARALVASGFLPCIGLFHQSASNAFNLADDVFEPFRPFVDRFVFALSGNGTRREGDLTIDDRRALAGALNINTLVGSEKISLLTATEKAAESLFRAMEHTTPAVLRLPAFAEGNAFEL